MVAEEKYENTQMSWNYQVLHLDCRVLQKDFSRDSYLNLTYERGTADGRHHGEGDVAPSVRQLHGESDRPERVEHHPL